MTNEREYRQRLAILTFVDADEERKYQIEKMSIEELRIFLELSIRNNKL